MCRQHQTSLQHVSFSAAVVDGRLAAGLGTGKPQPEPAAPQQQPAALKPESAGSGRKRKVQPEDNSAVKETKRQRKRAPAASQAQRHAAQRQAVPQPQQLSRVDMAAEQDFPEHARAGEVEGLSAAEPTSAEQAAWDIPEACVVSDVVIQPKSPVMPASPQQPSVPNFKPFRKVHPLHRSPTMQWEPDSYKQANEAAEFMREQRELQAQAAQADQLFTAKLAPAKKKEQALGKGQLQSNADPSKTINYGDEDAQALSQLSDLVVLNSQDDHGHALAQPYTTETFSQQGVSQEALELQGILDQSPSQPELPLGQLMQAADPGVGALQEPQQRDQPAAAPVQSSNELQQSQPGVEGGAGGWSAQEQAADLQHPKPTLIIHRPPHAPHAAPRDSDRADKPKTRTARRGPMDEMRQLVRILVKILVLVIPHSVTFIGGADEGGGGNRISEEQIKNYLDSILGEAPRPDWGVPQGWGAYISELFTWVLGRTITTEQAMNCAKREPGRSWESIDSELKKLGLFPNSWPLPLTNSGLAQVRGNAARQPGARATTARGHAAAPGHQLRQPAQQQQPVEPAPTQPVADTVQGHRGTNNLSDYDCERMSEHELCLRINMLVTAYLKRRHEQRGPILDFPMQAAARSRAINLMRGLLQLLEPSCPAAQGAPTQQAPAVHTLVPVVVEGPGGQRTQAFQLRSTHLPASGAGSASHAGLQLGLAPASAGLMQSLMQAHSPAHDPAGANGTLAAPRAQHAGNQASAGLGCEEPPAQLGLQRAAGPARREGPARNGSLGAGEVQPVLRPSPRKLAAGWGTEGQQQRQGSQQPEAGPGAGRLADSSAMLEHNVAPVLSPAGPEVLGVAPAAASAAPPARGMQPWKASGPAQAATAAAQLAAQQRADSVPPAGARAEQATWQGAGVPEPQQGVAGQWQQQPGQAGDWQAHRQGELHLQSHQEGWGSQPLWEGGPAQQAAAAAHSLPGVNGILQRSEQGVSLTPPDDQGLANVAGKAAFQQQQHQAAPGHGGAAAASGMGGSQAGHKRAGSHDDSLAAVRTGSAKRQRGNGTAVRQEAIGQAPAGRTRDVQADHLGGNMIDSQGTDLMSLSQAGFEPASQQSQNSPEPSTAPMHHQAPLRRHQMNITRQWQVPRYI
eukprot:jgi/Astpho2/504/fgenesh1_pg.00011_%23_75_t